MVFILLAAQGDVGGVQKPRSKQTRFAGIKQLEPVLKLQTVFCW